MGSVGAVHLHCWRSLAKGKALRSRSLAFGDSVPALEEAVSI